VRKVDGERERERERERESCRRVIYAESNRDNREEREYTALMDLVEELAAKDLELLIESRHLRLAALEPTRLALRGFLC
jgi:hypothetical protein